MTTPNYELKVDQHGRHVSALRPGASTEISVSGSAAGGSLQGEDILTLEARHVAVRLTSNVDVYVAFSSNDAQSAADSSDMLFLAGTEPFILPDGTSYVSVIAADGSSTGKFSVMVLN